LDPAEAGVLWIRPTILGPNMTDGAEVAGLLT
jgi:hypothetical protein